MAQELIPTKIQEEISLEYFSLLLDSNLNISKSDYNELLLDMWGKGGKFPISKFPNLDTEKGRYERLVWLDSFDMQLDAFTNFLNKKGYTKYTGWDWSRGDGMMGFLNNIASSRCGVKQLDSWNPMDIVAVQTSKEQKIRDEIDEIVLKTVDKDANKELLNGIMLKYINSKDLIPISLKKVTDTETGAWEESWGNPKVDLKYVDFSCDLEWSTVKHEWENSQEFSFSMIAPPSVAAEGVNISVQARAFNASKPRDKPQHSLSQKGAGAHLGKAPVEELEKFIKTAIKEYGVIPPYSPSSDPKIPSVGQPWTQDQKDHWIKLQKQLVEVTIGGQKIDFGTPGSYGKSGKLNDVFKKDANGKKTTTKLTGFAAALESACNADELGLKTKPEKRSCGSRLTTKFWGLEWLWRYHLMSKNGVWEAFAHRMLKAAKKELSDSGPFIKIYGEKGKKPAQIKLRIQKLIAEAPDVKPIYDPKLKNKKTGEIPVNKMIPKNIVGFESKDPFYDNLFGYEEYQ